MTILPKMCPELMAIRSMIPMETANWTTNPTAKMEVKEIVLFTFSKDPKRHVNYAADKEENVSKREETPIFYQHQTSCLYVASTFCGDFVNTGDFGWIWVSPGYTACCLKPVLNWANVCSPNILRTVRRTMIRFLIELLVRRTWFGQSKLYFILKWDASFGPNLRQTRSDSTIENVG